MRKLISFTSLLVLFCIILTSCGLFEYHREQTDAATEWESSSTQGVTYAPEDPYGGVSYDEFYSDYSPADSWEDAYYRTLHGFMSGSIAPQDQEPTISEKRPMENGMFIRNNVGTYADGGNTYIVTDHLGNEAFRVYNCGAYVSLEEVAAYLFAFGEIPPNYTAKKNTDPEDSIWGEYLRLNHTHFTGNTNKYPYEPELPFIDGCGGDITYYEIDIGTTGTDCDPRYSVAPYNNGDRITRGAARIVYTRYDKNGDKIIDINEKFLFYTNNHYNDFREYLNYEGGWGEIFGNITGGGVISSKTNCNPTPYVPSLLGDLRDYRSTTVIFIIWNHKDEKQPLGVI